jgi:hypothetical protein
MSAVFPPLSVALTFARAEGSQTNAIMTSDKIVMVRKVMTILSLPGMIEGAAGQFDTISLLYYNSVLAQRSLA